MILSISVLGRRIHDANMSAGFLFLLFTPGLIALPFMAMMPSNPLGIERFPGLTREERSQKRQETMAGVAEVAIGVAAAAAIAHQTWQESSPQEQPASAMPPPTPVPTHLYSVGQKVVVHGEGQARIVGLGDGESYYVEIPQWRAPSKTVRKFEPQLRSPGMFDL